MISQSDKIVLERMKINHFQTEFKEELNEVLSRDSSEGYPKACKISKPSTSTPSTSTSTSISTNPPTSTNENDFLVTDEMFASNLQALLNSNDLQNFDDTDIENLLPPTSVNAIIEDMRQNVGLGNQFFLTIRRNADLLRVLSLWGRQKKQSPKDKLMVRLIGENGIYSGALSKEFLTDVIEKIAGNQEVHRRKAWKTYATATFVCVAKLWL